MYWIARHRHELTTQSMHGEGTLQADGEPLMWCVRSLHIAASATNTLHNAHWQSRGPAAHLPALVLDLQVEVPQQPQERRGELPLASP
jgi:hypothetical protein